MWNWLSGRKRRFAKPLRKFLRRFESFIPRFTCTSLFYEVISIEELWKTIEEFLQYEVSNFGHVRNIHTGRLLHGSMNNNGYWRFDLCDHGKRFVRSCHQLVAKAFLDEIPGKTFVNHIDGNKTNNCVSNLEWCTMQENTRHAYDVLGCKPSNRIPVRCVETGVVFPSGCDAALWLGVANGSINRCCRGKRHTICGYHFEYAMPV